MLRKIALSLLMLVSLIVMLPLVNSTAHNIKYEAAQNQRRLRRHSRAWWRRHRAMMRRRQAARLRRRALAQARQEPNPASTSDNHAVFSSTISLPPAPARDAKSAPLSLPTGWLAVSAPSKGETNFRVMDVNGSTAGQAALSVVAASAPQPGRISSREQSRVLGGVSYSDLRRTVIDKMITSGGWVVNDMERQMGGRKVFVVVAQTPAANDGRESERIWNFYFTEVDGRVYSLSTSAARQTSNRIATDAEKFITSLPTMVPGTSRNSIR